MMRKLEVVRKEVGGCLISCTLQMLALNDESLVTHSTRVDRVLHIKLYVMSSLNVSFVFPVLSVLVL